MKKESIYDLTYPELEKWVNENGYSNYFSDQLWQYLYRDLINDFSEINDLNPKFIQLLNDNFNFSPLTIQIVQESAEDNTTKFLFQLADELMIETVLMYQNYGQAVCVTTQVGCNIGCKFCASGLIPKQRDLTSGEIVSQIMFIQRYLRDKKDSKVTNITVMGIGEPFDNYDNVMDFIDIVTHDKGLAIAGRKITVSTSGLAPKIREFADEALPVNLALSLHAPNNEVRSYLMRINNKYPLEELMDAIEYYINKTKKRVNMEYIMIKNVNDRVEHAKELGQLLKRFKDKVFVNLIPYNPVIENPFERSEKEDILTFFDTLMRQDVMCTVREEMGSDIDAACGQLRSKYMKEKRQRKLLKA